MGEMRMRLKRKIRGALAGGLGIWICLNAAGCRQEEAVQPVEITLMHGYGGTLDSYKKMQEIYADFSKQNQDIKLNCISYINNQVAVEKANDMLAVGKMPDILSTNSLSYFVDNAVNTGMALDLMPYIEEDEEWRAQIHTSVFETWQDEIGHLYTIPDALEWAGYWYNEEYFIKAGIVDENGNPDIPTTWEEMRETVQKLKEWIDESGKDISVFSLEEVQLIEYLFSARLAGTGEKGMHSLHSPEQGVSREAISGTIDELAFLKGFSEDVENIESARQRFSEGKTIIYFNGVWEAQVLMESKRNTSFDYANYPSESGESISIMTVPSGYILAKQEDKRKEEACIRFMKYMLSDCVQEKIAMETEQVPCNPDVNESVLADNGTLFGDAVGTVRKADNSIQTLTSVWDVKKTDIIYKNLIPVLEGQITQEEFFHQIETEIKLR